MKTQDQSSEAAYYTDQDIAQLLGVSIGRLRNKLSAGSPLPPRIQPPACRNRLWPKEAVHAWLEQFLITSASAPLQASGTQATVCGGGDRNQLEYPNGFLDQERRLAHELLAEFPTALAQQLLDELAGRMAGDTIRSAPLAYLRGLARRAKVGDFTPELALRVAGTRKRRRQVEAALHRAEAACEKDLAANATNKDDPLVRRLATLRSRLKGPKGNGG